MRYQSFARQCRSCRNRYLYRNNDHNNETIYAGDVCLQPGFDSDDSDLSPATAYFSAQDYQNGYRPNEAICHGTMFPELYQPMDCERRG